MGRSIAALLACLSLLLAGVSAGTESTTAAEEMSSHFGTTTTATRGANNRTASETTIPIETSESWSTTTEGATAGSTDTTTIVPQDTTTTTEGVISGSAGTTTESSTVSDGYHDSVTVTSSVEDARLATVDNARSGERNVTVREEGPDSRRERQMRPGRKSGQPCSQEQPCYEDFGLRCVLGVCSGPLSIEMHDITQNSAKVSWGSPDATGLQPQASLSYASVFRGPQTQWTKVQGSAPGASLDGLLPDQEYFVKVEQDGKLEVAVFRTKSVMTPMPKILVKQRSPSTLTVVWDDFRLPSYHSEYVLEYRTAYDPDQEWTKVKAGTQNIVTLSHLEPNTGYELKVAVWEDDKLELPSEVITAYTADGCVRGGTILGAGEEFFPDCEFHCKCLGGNVTKCDLRCTSPYVRAGSKTDDPLCYEKPHPSDMCCVIIRCSESRALEDREEIQNKTGECPTPVGDESETDESCLSDCDHDRDCSGPLKCCPSACGGAVCAQPALPEDVCQNVYCGPNAVCVSSQRACVCAEGYSGDPHDILKGCIQVNSSLVREEIAPVNGTFELDLRPNEDEETTTSGPPTGTPDSASGNELEQDVATTTTPFELDLREAGKSTDKPTPAPVEERNVTDNKTADEEDFAMPHLFDGCEYGNQTYERGASFDQGCEARCRCEGAGYVSCGPRCPPRADGGPLCREAPDPDDPCCQIMLCSFPDSNNMEAVDGLPLKIVSALAVNGSTLRIRVRLQAPPPPSSRGLEAWFREGGDNALPPWSRRRLSLRHLRQVGSEEFEFELSGLMPQTEYFVRVTADGMDFSNTVNVKTFPAAVRNVVEGCVHRNRSYAAGEVFYVGCEHKCVCRAGGAVECQDRCPLYIDHVGYEGCEWVPSEEDPLCCRVPLCTTRRIPSMLVPHAPDSALIPGGVAPSGQDQRTLCVVSEREVYRIGDIWETGDGCKLRVCRCAQLQDGTAQLQCHSQCPPPRPTSSCPKPILVRPEGPCSCPYLSCGEERREEQRPPARGPVMESARHCEFKGRLYTPGEEFYDGCSAMCHCGESDLHVSCATIECPHHFSPDMSACLEWSLDPDFFPEPPNCCAPAVCVNNGSCAFAGRHFENFESIPSSLLPCGALCVCVNGNVTCESRCQEVPPQDLPCPPERAIKAEPRPGEDCCPRWLCPTTNNAHIPAGEVCVHEGRTYAVSERWESTSGQACSCREGGRLECCPKVPARFLSPNEQCPRPVLVTPEDPLVCPYVVCNNTLSGQDLYNVQVLALNSSAVRVRFSLSPLLVGLAGHAELRLTNDPALPESSWAVQRFSRPGRLLDAAHIEYVVGGLRPGAAYRMRLVIRVDALQGGPQSQLFKLRMPEDETVKTSTTSSTTETTTSTTTTTTTVPPHIVIDTKMKALIIDPTTVRVSWKSIDHQEKKYIDGLRLRYTQRGGGAQEQTTPLIHRDITTYLLRDLNPASEYTVELEFVSSEGYPTHVESAHFLQFQTPIEHKEEKKKESEQEYDLRVSAPENEVGVGSAHLSFTGVPAGRVHVARVMYRPAGDKGGDMAYAFEVPKGGLVTLDSLKPGKKYMAKLELYLTNGQTLTSNEVEFITKQLKNAPKAIDRQQNNNGKMAEPLQAAGGIGEDEPHPYFIALIVVAVVAAVASLGFVLLLVVLVRRQHHSAKAPISRTPSESAYDNPTYKTYDGEREEKPSVQTTQT